MHVWNGNNWNNYYGMEITGMEIPVTGIIINFILQGLYCQISVNVKCIFGPMCHCYLNGFYSKETSVYNNNYVYYCCFQISL